MKYLCAALFISGSMIFYCASNFLNAEESQLKIISTVRDPGNIGLSLKNEANVAIFKGLKWLEANQRSNGSWSDTNFPALTALAVWPFINSDYPNKGKIIDKAVNFIKTFVKEDGGIYYEVPGRKGGGLKNYNTAICMTVLNATKKPEFISIIQNARKFIAGSQHFGDDEYSGGFGYDKETHRPYTDLLNTYYAVEAMRLTQNVEDHRPDGEQKIDVNWAETVKFIEKMQNKDKSDSENFGGFVYNPSDPKAGISTNKEGKIVFRSYGSITYAGMLALIYANVTKEDTRVISALDWASKHWTLEENPGMGQEGLFFFYNILSKALSVANIPAIKKNNDEIIDWRSELTKKIISLQRTDENGMGYWVNDVNRYWEGDKILVTAYSLIALQFATQ